jgi:plastocyanin
MVRRFLSVTVVLLACTAVTVALADGAQRRRKPATHTVTISGMQFTPSTVTVRAGDTVVWINKDIVAHTATSSAGSFDSRVIPPEKSWNFTFKAKGNNSYVCTYHPTMKGVVTVQ